MVNFACIGAFCSIDFVLGDGLSLVAFRHSHESDYRVFWGKITSSGTCAQFCHTDFILSIVMQHLLIFITGLPVWQSQSESGWDFFVFFVFFFFFSVSVKVLPVTALLSGIFVHRAFCSYFLRIERVVDFSGGHSRMINLTGNGVESHVTRMAF